MPKNICESQTGHMKSRYVDRNVITVQEVSSYLKLTKETGILLLLDFEKAFDSIEWEYIWQSHKKM